MRFNTVSFVTMLLAGILGMSASGCYTILAVDDSPAPRAIAPAEPAPIMVIVPPPPPPVTVPIAVQPPADSNPPKTVQRPSGPQREAGRTPAPSSTTAQRPVRTGRTR